MTAQSLTKEEEQLLHLCDEGTAPISQFAALLGQGVRLNIHDKDGNHPLWHVSWHGRRDLADLFLQHGAEVDLATNDDKLGETALIAACAYGHLETARLLVHRGAVVNYQRKCPNGFTFYLPRTGYENWKLYQYSLSNLAGLQVKFIWLNLPDCLL